jgi:hypothetical protein
MGKIRNAYKILVGKPEGNRLLVRTRSRLADNTEVNPNVLNWIQQAVERVEWQTLVNTVMKVGVLHKWENFLTT